MSFSNGIISFGDLSVTIMDLVIVLIVLIFAVSGAKKGFVKTIFGLLGTIAAIVGAVLLAEIVGGWLYETVGHYVYDPIKNWVVESAAGWTGTGSNPLQVVVDWSDATVSAGVIENAFVLLGLPSIVVGILKPTGLFANIASSIEAGSTLEEAIPTVLAEMAMTVIAFIIVFIVLLIIIGIIKKACLKAVRVPIVKQMNGFLGFVLGLSQAYVFLSIVFMLTSFLSTETLGGIFTSFFVQLDASTIGKFLAENNYIGTWLLESLTKFGVI